METEALPTETPVNAIFKSIEVRFITESATNPRKRFDVAAQDEMTDSVKRHGVLQPILVRPHPADMSGRRYELVSGARRFRGATRAGLFEIPAMVRELTDAEVLELQVVENLQRADLHELEEAEGYERLTKEFQYSIDDLVAKVGKSRAYIYSRLKLCALNEECRKAFYAGDITASVALLIARIPASNLQSKALADIVENNNWDGPMSYRQASDYVQSEYMLRLDRAPFPTEEADLVHEAGACGTCPKRTGNQPELFADVSHNDSCTDPTCFESKKIAWLDRRREEAEAKGLKVIAGEAAKKIKPDQYSAGLHGGYVRLDELGYQYTDPEAANRSKPLRKLIGKNAEGVELLADPHTGEMIEVIKKDALFAALEAKGVKTLNGSAERENRAQQKTKQQIDATFRERLFQAVRAAIPTKQLYDLKPVALAMFALIFNDRRSRLIKLLGWGTDSIDARIAQLTQEQTYLLLMDMALIGEAHQTMFADGQPEQMIKLAEQLELDHKALRREIQAELKPPAKSKTKAPRNAAGPKKKASPDAPDAALTTIDQPPKRRGRPPKNKAPEAAAADPAAMVSAA